MCETCKRVDPAWDVEHCTICFGHYSCTETMSIEPSSIAKYRKIPIEHCLFRQSSVTCITRLIDFRVKDPVINPEFGTDPSRDLLDPFQL
jgi:hypothetical protein